MLARTSVISGRVLANCWPLPPSPVKQLQDGNKVTSRLPFLYLQVLHMSHLILLRAGITPRLAITLRDRGQIDHRCTRWPMGPAGRTEFSSIQRAGLSRQVLSTRRITG